MYLSGSEISNWDRLEQYKFTRNDNSYTIHVDRLNGEFKVTNSDWAINYGALKESPAAPVTGSAAIQVEANGPNITAVNLTDVEISFTLLLGDDGKPLPSVMVIKAANEIPAPAVSGDLPIVYINVYNEYGLPDNEIISKDLNHKNYFAGEYWIEDAPNRNGGESVYLTGSKDEPLPLEIKARGNFTRTAFAKKPFKIKLGKKQNLLGLTPAKNKHYALLAHADDSKGYLRNFTGFALGQLIGLTTTPKQTPVELVINGDYRGLYFLTESIRVGEGRVEIAELADECSDPELVSGGYIVELDNYDEENQIRMEEKGLPEAPSYRDMLRVTFNTPEVYSDLQKFFIEGQFSAMNDLIGAGDEALWSYMDLDDAARYYLVEEIVSHTESYHGSTYLYRERGEGEKWHFSPLWDFGNAFNGPTDNYFYRSSPFGTTWLPSMLLQKKFTDKCKETWKWLMSNEYGKLEPMIQDYVESIKTAAVADRNRWKGSPKPNGGMDVVDNSDMERKKTEVLYHLGAKVNWMKSVYGNYEDQTYPEPERDTTPAAPLPDLVTEIDEISAAEGDAPAVYYNLQGMRIQHPVKGEIYIVRKGSDTRKIIM